MTRPRRSRASRAWQVEQLEARALLTTVYGPASFEPLAPATPEPQEWWAPRIAATATFKRGEYEGGGRGGDKAILFSTSSPFDLPLFGRDPARSAATYPPTVSAVSEAVAIKGQLGLIQGLEVGDTIASWKMDRSPDGPGPPLDFRFAMRAIAGTGPAGRGFFAFAISSQMRDGPDGKPLRFGFGPRAFPLEISPVSYWEGGITGAPTPLFAVAGSESQGELDNRSADRAEPAARAHEERGSAPVATDQSAAAAGTLDSSVMIWVDVDEWVGESSLSSIVLSRGELDPGALFPDEELPELTALLSTLLSELLGETAELAVPLSGPLQEITTLDPLDDSSLALTALLLTVSSDPDTAAGPAGTGSLERDAPTDAALADPPSWAGFVIGLDEAFEANRLAVRQWPAGPEPSRDDDEADEALEASEPEPTERPDVVDQALQRLDREQQPSSSPAVDELLRDLLEEARNEDDPAPDAAWRGAAGAASLCLALAPALWSERLGSSHSPTHKRAGQPPRFAR